MTKCLICQAEYRAFVDFGLMPIANGFAKLEELSDEYLFPMKVGFCENCKMVQLVEQPERERMFHSEYAFYSSTSTFMKQHFLDTYKKFVKQKNLNQSSFVVEIGCNDGIFLSNFVESGVPCLGVEPSSNVADVAREKGIEVVCEFFDKELGQKIVAENGNVDLIFSANVMCHIPYMHSIYEGIKLCLKPDGIFVFEDPYLGEVIQKNSFDQIYDEHVFLFSAIAVKNLAERHGLELFDVEPQITHGGSMRYFLGHKNSNPLTSRAIDLLEKERELGLDQSSKYQKFADEVDHIKDELICLLTKLVREGKKVVGYGATSKSTTVTNYFGITPDLVGAIYDTTPIKQNKVSPGAHIPILPYAEFRESEPDYVLLFAWNHAAEIMEKEKTFMEEGGRKWITYIPEVKVT